MESPVALRMTCYLNAVRAGQVSVEVAAASIVDDDVAHHVLDPDGVVGGLDHTWSTELRSALAPLLVAETSQWVLALPLPGAPGSLRGPVPLTRAAIEVGQAVLAARAGLALVPYRVGRAIQWRVFRANPPLPPASPYDAERQLSESVLSAARALARLDVAAGSRPEDSCAAALAPGYSRSQQATADKASRLLAACSAALDDDGASISAFEADARARQLRAVRNAAIEALCATASWLEVR